MKKNKKLHLKKFIKVLQDFTNKHDAGHLYLDTITEIFNKVSKKTIFYHICIYIILTLIFLVVLVLKGTSQVCKGTSTGKYYWHSPWGHPNKIPIITHLDT